MPIKFHLDPSNRLATVLERYRETDRTLQTGQQTHSIYRANRFTNGHPNTSRIASPSQLLLHQQTEEGHRAAEGGDVKRPKASSGVGYPPPDRGGVLGPH